MRAYCLEEGLILGKGVERGVLFIYICIYLSINPFINK